MPNPDNIDEIKRAIELHSQLAKNKKPQKEMRTLFLYMINERETSPDFCYATESIMDEENKSRMVANSSPLKLYHRPLWRKVTPEDLKIEKEI